MVQINFALKEVNCKVVYYGPGLSGKTTNLEVVHSKAPKQNVGELTSIATEGDRTLFFDFLPLNLGAVAGMTTKFQIYTVPGQVYYNSTRKLVLQGADGIVFVADSRRGKMDENLESFANLEENLREYGMDITTLPLVLQYNKRDLPDVYSVEELEQKLNKYEAPCFEAVAVTGEGVFPTLKKLSQMVLESLNRQHRSGAARPAARQKERAREPVVVGVGVSAKAEAPAAAGTQSVAQRPPPSPSIRTAAARAEGPPSGRPSTVVRESVTSSSGIKPIERKTLAQSKVIRKRVPGPGAGKPAAPGAPPPKKKTSLIAAVVIAAVGLAAAGAYFSGLLDSFMGK
jgi:hypothetical protein